MYYKIKNKAIDQRICEVTGNYSTHRSGYTVILFNSMSVIDPPVYSRNWNIFFVRKYQVSFLILIDLLVRIRHAEVNKYGG